MSIRVHVSSFVIDSGNTSEVDGEVRRKTLFIIVGCGWILLITSQHFYGDFEDQSWIKTSEFTVKDQGTFLRFLEFDDENNEAEFLEEKTRTL